MKKQNKRVIPVAVLSLCVSAIVSAAEYAHTLTVATVKKPRLYKAIGTVQAVDKSVLSSRIQAAILKMNVKEGDRIRKDQILVELNTHEIESRLVQAKNGLLSAMAVLVQATKARDRVSALYTAEAATAQDLENATAAQQRASAQVSFAKAQVAEAQTFVRYSKIRSPFDGVVEKRFKEPGEMASPGLPLLSVYSPQKMRIEVSVRESYISKVRKGDVLNAVIGSHAYKVVVYEISPSADPRSRSFKIKARIEQAQDLYPGLYGSIFIPIGIETILQLPHNAIQRVGQLNTVMVKGADGAWIRRAVTIGKKRGDSLEILSGIAPGDVVGY